MKKTIPGLVIGGVCAVTIFLTQVVFPNFSEDNMWVVLAVYLLIFLALFAAGFWHKITGGSGGGIRVGSITGVITLVIIMGTYFFVDNVFLETVSRQTEKIWGLSHSPYRDMRQYLNISLLKGLALGLPLFAFFGGVFGGMGGVTATYFFRKRARRFTLVLSFLRKFSPYATVITVLAAVLLLTGFVKPGYQLLTGWVFALATVLFILIITELLRRAEKRHK